MRRVIVEPFIFSGASKSELGWDFLGLIDCGLFKQYADDGDDLTRVYRHQLAEQHLRGAAGAGPAAALERVARGRADNRV